MTYNLNQFDASETVSDGKFTGILGITDPCTRGLIFENDELVSVSFGYSPCLTWDSETVFERVWKADEVTSCFEGPLVKVWWDSEEQVHLSTTNKLDCTNSYWGNKEERFGPLFYNNGGTKFLEKVKPSDLTHHFMIMTNSLLVTSDIDLKDNDCVVVYLGSVSKDSRYLNLEMDVDIFFHQLFDSIPQKEQLEGRILYPHVWKIQSNLRSTYGEYLSSVSSDQGLSTTDKEVLTDLSLEALQSYRDYLTRVLTHSDNSTMYLDPLTEEEEMRGVDLGTLQTYLGSPVIVRGDGEIVKIVPPSYEKKCNILGNSPNIALRVFTLMSACRPKSVNVIEYFETYDFLFVPTPEFLEKLEASSNVKKDIIDEYRRLGSTGFMNAKEHRNIEMRERNLMMVLLLCFPQCKAKKALLAYKDYLETKRVLKNYIRRNLDDIIEGKKDESLKDLRVIGRVKDMALRSKSYAQMNQPFGKSLEYSLTGLIENELGASLYRIHKALTK